jgi:hypothetical protein
MRPLALSPIALGALLLLSACSGGKESPQAKTDASPTAAEPAGTEGEAPPGGPLSLSSGQVEKLGLKMQPASESAYHEELAGYAQVWSHEAVAQVVADVATAEAAARQSAAALARIQKLAGSPGAFPADATEAAERQASSDEAALLLAGRKLSALLGDSLPWKESTTVLAALASGRVKLVRITFPLGSGPRQTPHELRLLPLNEAPADKGWKSQVVWDAPADSTVPGHSVWATASGAGLLEGDRLLARAPEGRPLSGTLVPDAALVVSDDRYWCIVEKPAGTFRRVEIDTHRPVDAGYIMTQGISPGDRLVVRGAGLLLARIMNAGSDSEE